ncbi:hypothetical protein Trydic_g12751 [Trypoxylus dichotomus]
MTSALALMVLFIPFVFPRKINNCPRPNEILKCGGDCEKECWNLEKECPIINICRNDCYCVDGYVRDDRGFCIPVEECDGFIYI